MKNVLILSLLGVGTLHPNNKFNHSGNPITTQASNKATGKELQLDQGDSKMSVVEFKAQDYCRIELADFEYDVHFSVVGATVYFSGTNFSHVEMGKITSNSLAPIKSLMKRCAPGSIVVFDDVKVVGPDKEVRTIAGKTWILF